MLRSCTLHTCMLSLALICTTALSAAVQAQTIFIDDATVYTMGTPPVIQDADVLIRNGMVVQVGVGLSAPVDATLIEAFGRPVTPAFFAGITALGLEEISAEEPSVDQALVLEELRPEFDVSLAYNPFSTSIPVTRIEGYGWTMLGASRSGSIIGGLGRAVSLDGGFDSFISEPALFIGLGAQTSSISGQSRAAQFMLLNQAITESTTDPAWIPDAVLTLEGRKVLAGFREHGVVVFDVHRAADILQVLAFAERNSLSPVISGGAEAWMVAEILADTGVPVLLDPFLNLPGTFDQIGARLDNAAILHDFGVTIAFTGSGDTPHNARKLRQGAGIAVAYGLPFEAAIAALTSNPADIFKLEGDHGRIVADAPANLVLWSGDPLEVTSLAEAVVLDGKQIPMVSRQTLLRDRYLPQNPAKPRAYIKP